MTPRRRSTVRTASDPLAQPQGAQGFQGKAGSPGSPGLAGPSVFREISEASSSELYGEHRGFVVPATNEPPLECGFEDWEAGDALQLDYWVQIPESGRTSPITLQAQISLDAGLTWQAVSGLRTVVTCMMTSVGASISIELPSRPIVRIYTPGMDCGPGPEGATVVLRAVRWAAGTFRPRARLVPPLRGA